MSQTSWKKTSFSNIDGWERDDHEAALSCLKLSARAIQVDAEVSRRGVDASGALLRALNASLTIGIGKRQAQAFFEKHFIPWQHEPTSGFITAYFEPEMPASLTRTREYAYPLHQRPPDLVRFSAKNPRPANLDPALEFGRRNERGEFEEFPDRAAIDNGALEGQGLELVYLKSPIDAFYIHIQGSARLLLTDGRSMRVSYAGKTGHPYTSIGRLLVQRETLTLEKADMKGLRAYLEADLDRAMEVLHNNRSYIFFAPAQDQKPDLGPLAGAGVQLTPGRSLAVDHTIHSYGTPVWVRSQEKLPHTDKVFARLMIAQDTGSAIVGPERGDVFMGSGEQAGVLAGGVRHKADFIVLRPVGDEPHD